MIKVVLWDVDGTLLNFKEAEKAGIRSCFRIFNLGICTDEMIKEYSLINDKYWEMLERKEMTKPEILVNRFKEFFNLHSIDASIAKEFNDRYQMELGETICFYDNALETLKFLKGKVLECAVTNGTKFAQDRKLKKSGMDRIFDEIFISDEIGHEKPSKEFFDTVFDKIGNYSKEEVLIVGDSLTSDILGGINCGIKTCWFNPLNKPDKLNLKIDYIISDLKEVTDIVLEEP